ANGKPLPQDRWGNYIQPKPVKKSAAVVVEEPPPSPEPDEPALDPNAIVIPDFAGMGVGRALDEARKLQLDIEIVGSGHVIEQAPAPGPTTNAGRVKLRFSDDTRKFSAP